MYFKDERGGLHFLASDESRHLLPDGCQPLDDADANEIIEAGKPSAFDMRRSAIAKELRVIDTDSARPARAVAVALAAGTPPNAFDQSKLQALEARAAALRKELAAL